MSEELTGGCACGAVRYTVKPGFRMKPYACHCTDCQRRSGSAFAVQMIVMRADLEAEGETLSSEYAQPSGATARMHACPRCLCRIYGINTTIPEIANLRAGTLDNSRELVPAVHFWVKSKQSWVVIPDDVPALETQPQSQEEWMELLGAGR